MAASVVALFVLLLGCVVPTRARSSQLMAVAGGVFAALDLVTDFGIAPATLRNFLGAVLAGYKCARCTLALGTAQGNLSLQCRMRGVLSHRCARTQGQALPQRPPWRDGVALVLQSGGPGHAD